MKRAELDVVYNRIMSFIHGIEHDDIRIHLISRKKDKDDAADDTLTLWDCGEYDEMFLESLRDMFAAEDIALEYESAFRPVAYISMRIRFRNIPLCVHEHDDYIITLRRGTEQTHRKPCCICAVM